MVANIEQQTGKSLPQWVEVVARQVAEDPEKASFSDIVDWLKDAHGFGHFQARLIATEYNRTDAGDRD